MKTFMPSILPFKAQCVICKKPIVRSAYEYQGPYVTGDYEYVLHCDPRDKIHYSIRFDKYLSIIGERVFLENFVIDTCFIENKSSILIDYKNEINIDNFAFHFPSLIKEGIGSLNTFVNLS